EAADLLADRRALVGVENLHHRQGREAAIVDQQVDVRLEVSGDAQLWRPQIERAEVRRGQRRAARSPAWIGGQAKRARAREHLDREMLLAAFMGAPALDLFDEL